MGHRWVEPGANSCKASSVLQEEMLSWVLLFLYLEHKIKNLNNNTYFFKIKPFFFYFWWLAFRCQLQHWPLLFSRSAALREERKCHSCSTQSQPLWPASFWLQPHVQISQRYGVQCSGMSMWQQTITCLITELTVQPGKIVIKEKADFFLKIKQNTCLCKNLSSFHTEIIIYTPSSSVLSNNLGFAESSISIVCVYPSEAAWCRQLQPL